MLYVLMFILGALTSVLTLFVIAKLQLRKEKK